ncbi:MAG: hypothetical protein NTW54_11075 [Bacteroidetes bacterium]|nr:hypothetical protein [Bacteroidota bacterium]
MKLFNQPQYALAMKNNLCSFIAYINDIPAFNNSQGTAYNISVPINHLIINGENTFKVLVTPLKSSQHLEELSECFAIILVKDVFDNADQFVEISITGIPAGTSNDTLKLPAFEIKGKFEASLPFDDYTWVNAPKLDKNRSTNIDLARHYFRAFHNALDKQNTNYIFHEIVQREKEFSMAFYDDYEDGYAKTQKDFNDTLNDENYQLQAMDLGTFLPRFYADDRIITFENEKHEQPVFFLNDVEFTRRQYPLYLCLNKKNEMLLIR